MRMRGRNKEPKCPFCGRLFEKPHDIKAKLGNVFSGGRCECGTAYVYDRSGHNLGDAYVDCLVLACNDDWDTAWTLTPEVDYKIASVYYDEGSHQMVEDVGKARRGGENLLFIALEGNAQKQLQGDK